MNRRAVPRKRSGNRCTRRSPSGRSSRGRTENRRWSCCSSQIRGQVNHALRILEYDASVDCVAQLSLVKHITRHYGLHQTCIEIHYWKCLERNRILLVFIVSDAGSTICPIVEFVKYLGLISVRHHCWHSVLEVGVQILHERLAVGIVQLSHLIHISSFIFATVTSKTAFAIYLQCV